LPGGVEVEHHMQTNATLIDDAWCDFIHAHALRVGVSIDGPADLHDAKRRSRNGAPTHARVMVGVRRLQAAGIAPNVICVLTRPHLDRADDIFDFFLDAGLRDVAFNVEEIEGVNAASTLSSADTLTAFAAFFSRILERYRACDGAMTIREIDRVVEAMLDPAFGSYADSSLNRLFGIICVAWDGGVGTFSPELLGISHERYGSFVFGNVHADSLAEIARNRRLRRVSDAIGRGVRRCRDTCRYFNFCRGGAPANKLAEIGTFNAADTLYCSLTQILTTETVLRALSHDLPEAALSTGQTI